MGEKLVTLRKPVGGEVILQSEDFGSVLGSSVLWGCSLGHLTQAAYQSAGCVYVCVCLALVLKHFECSV